MTETMQQTAERQTIFDPTPKGPESFEDSKKRVLDTQIAHLQYRNDLAQRELALQSGVPKIWDGTAFVPVDQVPPPPPPPPGPAIGEQVAAIRASKLENARNRYYAIMRERDEKSAAELEKVAGVLGFSVERVLADLKTIATATDLVRECLALEDDDVDGKADRAVDEMKEFEAETLRIMNERHARFLDLTKIAQEADRAKQHHHQQAERVRKMSDEQPELLAGIWLREINARG